MMKKVVSKRTLLGDKRKIKFSKYKKIDIVMLVENIDPKELDNIKVDIFLDKDLMESYRFQCSILPNEFKIDKTIEIEFIFERKQTVFLDLYNKNNERIGKVEFILGRLVCSRINCLRLPVKKDKILVVTYDSLRLCAPETSQLFFQEQFLSYLQGSLQISVLACIDFTASNLQPKGKSLHEIVPGKLNEYQTVISSVCNIVLDYDEDNMIPVYGFGGKPQFKNLRSNKVSHFFPLTGDPDSPFGNGVEEVFNIYGKALGCIKMSGPTLFSPLLKEVALITEEQYSKDPFHYTVLLILTDGIIHDMEDTLDLIVMAANLPLSIVIIGVGDEDFTEMNELDSDGKVIKSRSGQVAKRDIVQFVAYKHVKDLGPDELAAHVLGEIPIQVSNFYKLADLSPLQAKKVSVNSLAQNLEDIGENDDYSRSEVKLFSARSLIMELNNRFASKTDVGKISEIKSTRRRGKKVRFAT